MISILVGGDVYPAGKVQRAFINGNAREVFGDLLEDIAAADLSIVNLECPLIAQETPIVKAGPVLGATTDCIRGFAAAGWDVLNLANNHSYDHGAPGLRETMRTARHAGLESVGAGENIHEAKRPLIREIGGQRIVIYSMAEREFSVADEQTAGANPLDLINVVSAIREHKQQGIFIVLLHGGTEYYPYPSPEMVRRCRFMVDMGADAVVCCHAHCSLPWETYAGRPIVYGLGNLVFEPLGQEVDTWYQGYLAVLTVEDKQVRFEPVPYCQSQGVSGARRMTAQEVSAFLGQLESRGSYLKEPELLSREWVEHCRSRRDSYLAMLFGYRGLMLRVQQRLFRFLHSEEAVRQSLLLVQCEAHREALSTIFDDVRSCRS